MQNYFNNIQNDILNTEINYCITKYTNKLAIPISLLNHFATDSATRATRKFKDLEKLSRELRLRVSLS